jgi:NitT/TauT family transport system ATP-binding protein
MSSVVLQCENIHHWFGPKRVLHNINLSIYAGQIVALVGPSGCGKSTLFRAILGTHPPSSGRVVANGQTVTRPSRDIGIVYQNYGLYDFMNALDNVAFGPMLDQTGLAFRFWRFPRWWRLRRTHRKHAADLLGKVRMPGVTHLYPHEMSGGMRQRVAIAQALIMEPKILLLDEPFGALDEATREDLQSMLLHLYQDNLEAKLRQEPPPYTILIVTHELNEALYVADRVVGLSQYHPNGQLGATIVYDQPAPVFHPSDLRDFQRFEVQKEEIRRIVFEPEAVQHHDEYVQFCNDLANMAASG